MKRRDEGFAFFHKGFAFGDGNVEELKEDFFLEGFYFEVEGDYYKEDFEGYEEGVELEGEEVIFVLDD